MRIQRLSRTNFSSQQISFDKYYVGHEKKSKEWIIVFSLILSLSSSSSILSPFFRIIYSPRIHELHILRDFNVQMGKIHREQKKNWRKNQNCKNENEQKKQSNYHGELW